MSRLHFSSGNIFTRTLAAAVVAGSAAGALVHGDVEVVATTDSGSTHALLLLQGTPPGSVSYAVTGASAGVYYLDFGIRPAVTASDAPFVTLDGAEVAFATSSPGGVIIK